MRLGTMLTCFSILVFSPTKLFANPTIPPNRDLCLTLQTNAGRSQRAIVTFTGDKSNYFEEVMSKREKRIYSIGTTSSTNMSLSVLGFYSKNGWRSSRVKTSFRAGSYTYFFEDKKQSDYDDLIVNVRITPQGGSC